MSDGDSSAAMQLIQEAASSARAAEAASSEARHAVDLLRGQVHQLSQLVDKHEEQLDGNGSEGIKERLSHAKRTADSNRKWLERLQKGHDAVAGHRWEFWKVVIAAAISAAGGVVAGLLAAGGN